MKREIHHLKTKFDEKRKPVICQNHFPGTRRSACFTTLLQQSEVSVSIEQTSRNTELKQTRKVPNPLKSSLVRMFKSLVFVPRRFFRRWSSVDFSTASYLAGKITIKKIVILERYLSTTLYPAADKIFFGNFISYKQEIFSCLHGDC